MLFAVGGEVYGEVGGLSCVYMYVYIAIMRMRIKTQALFR